MLTLGKLRLPVSEVLERRTGPSVSSSHQKLDFLDLKPEKYDICILSDAVNGVDTCNMYSLTGKGFEKYKTYETIYLHAL